MNKEIEKKFLLKSLPKEEPSEVIEIDQYYLEVDEIWERCRMCNSNVKGVYYVHTIKTYVSKGVNMEDEKIVSKSEYEEFVEKCYSGKHKSKYIKKKRLIYPDRNLKWEVDVFDNMSIAEIEIPELKYPVKIPDFLKPHIVLEVTGIKEFNNRSLAKKIKVK